VGQAAVVPKSGDWGWVTMQHGSALSGGQPEGSGGWAGGSAGWCVALRIRVQGGSPLPPTLRANASNSNKYLRKIENNCLDSKQLVFVLLERKLCNCFRMMR
jgi:hypothetical protein